MKRPLVIWTLIFCLGLVAARRIEAPFRLVYIPAILFFLLSLLTFKRKLSRDLFLSCFIFFFGMALSNNSETLPRSHISRFYSYKNIPVYTLKGVVNSQPLFRKKGISFIFKAEEIQFESLSYATCGDILVNARGSKPQDLRYGEELVLRGSIHKSYRDYLHKQGVFSVMNVQMPGSIVRLRQDRGILLKRLAFRLKQGMEEIIFKRVSSLSAGIMDAMILGERKNIPANINNAMMKSGTVHILVVSGFNVALVAFTVLLCLKLVRIPRQIRFFIAIPLIMIYSLITGASTPVVRAAIMATVFMAAPLIRREADVYNSTALAALFILMLNPKQLSDIGFQLSFASVISIVCLYPTIKSLLPERILKIRYTRFLVEGFLVSLSAWLGTAGLIAYYFGIISPVTVLANIFIVPLASLITLCGFSLLLIEFICPVLAPFFAYSGEFIVTLLLNVNAFLIKLPCAYFYLRSLKNYS